MHYRVLKSNQNLFEPVQESPRTTPKSTKLQKHAQTCNKPLRFLNSLYAF